MNKEYMCYCGMYCGNCMVKAQVEPASKVLYDVMQKAGFEENAHMTPDGEKFWSFMKTMSEDGACKSCQDGSGDPKCSVRVCAQARNVEVCALCEIYPCDKLESFFHVYPVLKDDNEFLRTKGMDAWMQMQDERQENGFVYTHEA